MSGPDREEERHRKEIGVMLADLGILHTVEAKLVWSIIAANRVYFGLTEISIQQLAKQSGCNHADIRRALEEIEAGGLLVRMGEFDLAKALRRELEEAEGDPAGSS